MLASCICYGTYSGQQLARMLRWEGILNEEEEADQTVLRESLTLLNIDPTTPQV